MSEERHSSHDLVPGDAPRVGILERNKVVGARIQRVVQAAAGINVRAIVEAEPRLLRERLHEDPLLLLCDASDLDIALDWARKLPHMAVVAWTSTDVAPALNAAIAESRVGSVIGWSPASSMPRAWELLLATRRSLGTSRPSFPDLLPWGATRVRYSPKSTRDRDVVVANVTEMGNVLGGARVAHRVGEVAYELLMNAMYDAPVNQYGEPKYAFDRARAIELEPDEVPTLRFASDGANVFVHVADRFGRLSRDHILAGIARGRAAAEDSASTTIDARGGGAGLGLFRVYASSTGMLAEVVPGEHTEVSVWIDMDVSAREARSIPTSLHLPPA